MYRATFKRFLSGNKKLLTSQPPALFQDATNIPLPYPIQSKVHGISTIQTTHPSTPIVPRSSSINPDGKKLSIMELFKNKETRGATIKLFTGLGLLQVVVFFISLNAVMDELEDTESKLVDLWGFYERKDISQTVMAVHIGQLKQQLLKSGINPITPQQALTVSQHLLSFARDPNTGNLMIYVDPNSQIYKLVPFSYEYDIQKIPKLNLVVDQTWEEYNNGTNDKTVRGVSK